MHAEPKTLSAWYQVIRAGSCRSSPTRQISSSNQLRGGLNTTEVAMFFLSPFSRVVNWRWEFWFSILTITMRNNAEYKALRDRQRFEALYKQSCVLFCTAQLIA